MTETMQSGLLDDDDMPDEDASPRPKGRMGRPRRDRGEPKLLSDVMARRLVEQAREEGLDIAGNAGLLQQMMKSVLESALAEELTDHLGYEPGDRAGGDQATAATAALRRRC